MWALALGLLAKILPTLTGINFGQIFNSIIGNVIKYWKFYVPVLLIALQLTTAYGWYHDHNVDKVGKIALQTELINVKNAQAAATKLAAAEKAQLQQENQVKANEADQNYSALLSKYNANLLRYSNLQSSPSKSGSSQSNSTSQSGNGSGGSTEFPQVTDTGNVTIPLSDAQICATNTARLQAVHDWAITLNGATN